MIRIKAIAGSSAALVALALCASSSVVAQNTTTDKQRMISLGQEHETAWDLSQVLREEANGGRHGAQSQGRVPDKVN